MDLGCVIKDNEKRVVLSASKKTESFMEPSIAEVLALRWGIQVAMELKLKTILVHSYAIIMVDYVNMIKVCVVLEPITLDCIVFLKNFAEASVMFVGRNLNVEVRHLIGIGNVI